MSAPNVIVRPAGAALDLTGSPAERLLHAWFEGRSPATLRSYRGDLRHLAAWLGVASPEAAVQLLLSVPTAGGLNELVLRYRNGMVAAGLSPNTTNRRLSAVRSVLALGRLLGMTGHSVEVANVAAATYRDCRGPGTEGVRKLLAQLEGRTDAKGRRDFALVQLLYGLGLRRKEAVGLDWPADVDLDGNPPGLHVLGKGRSARERLTLPARTADALRAWLGVRGGEPGPLFVGLAPGGKRKRLSGTSVYRVVRGLGEGAGVRARPHGLRHAGISRVLDLTGGNIREAMKFSRHRKPETVLVYDDARQDVAGQLARRLADDL